MTDYAGRAAERLQKVSTTAYPQVVGLVQSLAVTSLLKSTPIFQQGLHQFSSTADFGLFLFAATQFACTFWLIVLTLHVNIQITTVYEVEFDILDSAIPLAFAIPEYMMSVTADPHRYALWLCSVAFFMLIAICSWYRTYSGIMKRQRDTPHGKIFAKYVHMAATYIAGALAWAMFARFTPGIDSAFGLSVMFLIIAMFWFLHRALFWLPVCRLVRPAQAAV